MSESVKLDQNRIRDLIRSILECISAFEKRHDDDEVLSKAEILSALGKVLGYSIARFNSYICREGVADAVREYIDAVLRDAVSRRR